MIQQQPSESVVIRTLLEMSGITPEKVHKHLKELVATSAQPLVLFMDINDIQQATTYSRKFLEDYILSDPRIKRYERQREKGGKRVWLKEPTARALQEIIMNEWY